jgi:hypothetical protein
LSTGKAWGIYTQKTEADGNIAKKVEVLYGEKTELAE